MQIRSLLVALCAIAFLFSPVVAQEKKDDAKPKRTAEQIQADLSAASNELRAVLADLESILVDKTKREAAAPKAIPGIRKMSTLLTELSTVSPETKDQIAPMRMEFLTLLVAFGDPEAKTELANLAKAEGRAGVEAQLSQHFADWLIAGKDEAAQTKTLDEVEKLAKSNPKEDSLVGALMRMSQMGAASPAISKRAEDIIVTTLTGDMAKMAQGQLAGSRKQNENLGKPVELTGTTVAGEKFSTKDWKGKVILVDFWATWCGPCIQELPRVKKAYFDYHAKGLEILGVSCDSDVEQLKAFMEKNKDKPWPQLFDAQQNAKLEWHPLAKEWGINGIPTMFLIDRKGILRSVKARGEFEELIPKLLEEKAE